MDSGKFWGIVNHPLFKKAGAADTAFHIDEVSWDDPESQWEEHVSSDQEYLVFSWEEIKEVIGNLSTQKAPGPNGLPGDLLRYKIESWAPILTNYSNMVLRSNIPESWARSIIVPIFKKRGRHSTIMLPPYLSN